MSLEKTFYTRTATLHFENGFDIDLPEENGRIIHPEVEQLIADEAFNLGVRARLKLIEIVANDKRLANKSCP